MYIFGKLGKKKVFGDIVETKKKTPFHTMKTKTKKILKSGILLKWLVHGFGQKIGFFPPFYINK